MPTTILITAGELSGDRLGGAIMASLKRHRSDLKFIGVGGPEMQKQGLNSLFPIEDLSVMGLAEVVPAIPRILNRIKKIIQLSDEEKPDLLLTIDSQSFSSRVAKAVRARHGIPCLQYAAPKVWAWRPGRVKKLKNIYSHVLAQFPFEPEFFTSRGLPCTYVGHPAVTQLAPYQPQPGAHTDFALALLPGSRGSEIKRHWPVFLATFRRLRQLHPQLKGHLALPNQRLLNLCRQAAPWEENLPIEITLAEARFPMLARCRAALAKSGTSNLELAILGVPSVVAYKMHGLTYAIAKRVVDVRFINLPNLILGKVVYPEFIQNAANDKNLTRALHPLLNDSASADRQKVLMEKVRQSLKTPKPPADMAAEVVLAHLPQPKPAEKAKKRR